MVPAVTSKRRAVQQPWWQNCWRLQAFIGQAITATVGCPVWELGMYMQGRMVVIPCSIAGLRPMLQCHPSVQEPGLQPSALGPTSFAGLQLGGPSKAAADARKPRTPAGPSNLLGMLHKQALRGSQEGGSQGDDAVMQIRSIIHGAAAARARGPAARHR